MYIGVLSPQRGLPARSAYASKIAAIAAPVAIPGRIRGATSSSRSPHARIVGIRRDVVQEPLGVDGPAVPPCEEGHEERLVGDRDARRTVEDHPQERRPRAADAENDEWRPAHSAAGGTTSTAARAARPPTVTYSE